VSDPGGPSPWADPSTPTEPGAPYGGPPPTAPNPYPANPYGYHPPGYPAPNPYGQQPYGHPMPWGAPPWGPTPWGPMPPRGPQRPGQVLGAAVLSFVQAALVLFSSLYLLMILSMAGLAVRQAPSAAAAGLVTEGRVLAAVQGISVALLIAGGVGALTRRSRAAWLVLIGAGVVQVTLALYWAIRLQRVLSDIPGPSAGGAFAVFTVFFAAAPLVVLGLVGFGPGRRWFDPGATPPTAGSGTSR
jgi:hypothetical protein